MNIKIYFSRAQKAFISSNKLILPSFCPILKEKGLLLHWWKERKSGGGATGGEWPEWKKIIKIKIVLTI